MDEVLSVLFVVKTHSQNRVLTQRWTSKQRLNPGSDYFSLINQLLWLDDETSGLLLLNQIGLISCRVQTIADIQ